MHVLQTEVMNTYAHATFGTYVSVCEYMNMVFCVQVAHIRSHTVQCMEYTTGENYLLFIFFVFSFFFFYYFNLDEDQVEYDVNVLCVCVCIANI